MVVRTAMAVLALGLALTGSAQAKGSTPKPLFAANDVIKITLKGPIDSLARGSRARDKIVDGTLTVEGASPETLPVKLSARGITRRDSEVCPFPPIRVEFPEKPTAGLFKGQKRLKLVTHCRPAESFQQYVLLEYSAYRIYNQLTPVSFNARLATVAYVDAAGKPLTTRIGYFLEDIDDVAKRNGMSRFKTKGRIAAAQLSAPDAARFALFEYMIGNLDWAMGAGPQGTDCCHNSRPLGAEGATTNLIPTPYDFDFSGMVDAPYATPPAGIKLSNVRVRMFRGYCAHNAQVAPVAADLVARRTALIGVLDTIPQLDPKVKEKASAYLGGFFQQVATPADVAKLTSTCLG
jgi:hypothetical protein